jgi:hypothetical protein
MISIVDPFISQERLDVPPGGMLLGMAVKDLITGAVPSVDVFTVTEVSAVSVPKVLTADNL